MSIGTVFIDNDTQAVRLPWDVRLPEGIHEVEVRVRGNERVIAPLGRSWDSFFLNGPAVSDDFKAERASQPGHPLTTTSPIHADGVRVGAKTP